MKFNQVLQEDLNFKDFKPGMKVSIKRTPWDEEEHYIVDRINKDVNDETEVYLKRVKDDEEYIVDREEMKIIKVKKIDDDTNDKELKKEKSNE